MTGGIVQLSLWGAEDIVLSSQPQITYFKSVFRRPTPFAQSAEEQNFQGTSDFGRRCSLSLSRSGDLCTEIWLQITLPSLDGYAENLTAPTANRPVIRWARYASPTSARVSLRPPLTLSALSAQLYAATLTPDDGGPDVTGTSSAADPLTILVTGLAPGVNYAAAVVAVDSPQGLAAEVSESVDVIALAWANSIGHALVESVEVECGGARVDRHTSDWLDIWTELTTPEEKRAGLWEMLGKFDQYDPHQPGVACHAGETTLYVPMQFFFNTSSSLALPLVALVYHETRLNFQFRDYKDCVRSTRHAITTLVDEMGYPLAIKEIRAFANMVYLESDERRRYSTIPHEILISQTQFLGDAAINVQEGDALSRKIPLEFSHPVKEIVWVFQPYDNYAGDSTTLDWFGYGTDDFFDDARIVINGHDRFSARPPGYFRLCQPYAHHTRVPNKRIYSYSFALHPEQGQASGTCNYSRIDTSQLLATLRPTLGKGRVRIFATSFNVFRIANGLGGLSFAG